MRILCVFGQYNYGDPARGGSYEAANFLTTFRRLGHEVELFDCWARSRYRGFDQLNHALLEAVRRFRPDVVFAVQMHYEIWTETWQLVRRSGCATLNWATDDSWKYSQFSRFLAPYFDLFATTYPHACEQYHRDGLHNVILTQWAASAADLRPPLPAAECRYLVSFVGTAHGTRPKIIRELRKSGIQVACFGHGWPGGAIASAEIPAIVRRSVISLNFANVPSAGWPLRGAAARQIKARVFEIPGTGGFLLTEAADGLDGFFIPGREIATWEDVPELAERIRYYLSHPEERDAMAEAGYARTRREHTYDSRLSSLLERALQEKREKAAERAPFQLADGNYWSEAVRRHRTPWYLRVLREILVCLCSCVWGRKRGARAARRILFELSWRILGAKTYSSSGWPGRLFYAR